MMIQLSHRYIPLLNLPSLQTGNYLFFSVLKSMFVEHCSIHLFPQHTIPFLQKPICMRTYCPYRKHEVPRYLRHHKNDFFQILLEIQPSSWSMLDLQPTTRCLDLRRECR